MAFEHALARLEVPGDVSSYATKIWTACQSAIYDSTHNMQASTSPRTHDRGALSLNRCCASGKAFRIWKGGEF